MRLYRRGATWWVAGYDAGGRRYRISTRQRDRAAAERVARQVERARANEAYSAPPAALGLALANVLAGDKRANRADGTREIHALKGRHLMRILGEHTDLRGLSPADCLRYADARLAEGASRNTVHMELAVLRLAVRRAGLEWRREHMPDLGRYYTPRETWLTPAQVEALCAVLPRDHADCVRFVAQTGLRYSEVQRLEWEHVDLIERRMLVPGTKTQAARRWAPLSPAAFAILESRMKGAGPVFGVWGNATRDLARASKRAQVPRVSMNDLRRTFASWLAQAGVSSLTTAKLLGHTSTRMVERVYAKLSAEALTAAVGRLPGCDTGVPAKGVTPAKGVPIDTPRKAKSQKKPRKHY